MLLRVSYGFDSRQEYQKTPNAILHSVFFGTPSREFVLGSSIRHSRILAEGLPLAGNGKFPHISTKTIIAILHSVFFGTLSRESVLGSSIRHSRILAEFGEYILYFRTYAISSNLSFSDILLIDIF